MEMTQELIREHTLILKGLACLALARDALEKDQHPPRRFFDMAVRFFRNYADKFHHYKEEYLMFGFLAKKQEGELDLEMGALRYQHEVNRACIAKIEKSLNGYGMGSEIAVTTLLVNLSSFISILRRHIYREDHLFFPMAEKELSKDEKELLIQQFRQEEAAMGGTDITEINLGLLREMAELISETGYRQAGTMEDSLRG